MKNEEFFRHYLPILISNCLPREAEEDEDFLVQWRIRLAI